MNATADVTPTTASMLSHLSLDFLAIIHPKYRSSYRHVL